MRLIVISIIFLSFLSCNNTNEGETKNVKTISENKTQESAIVQAANQMINFMQKMELDKMAEFIRPEVFNKFGGKDLVFEALRKQMTEGGYKILDYSITDLSKPVEFNETIQHTMTQTMEVKFQGQLKTMKSILIAISEDKGATWKFIDTANQPKERILNHFSFVSPDLEFQQF